jgi:hypothetical protein
MSVQIHSVESAALRMKAIDVGAVRSYIGLKGRDRARSMELVGQFTRIQRILDDTDVEFTIVTAPDYEPVRLRLSRCDVAPLQDGRPAWEHAFTIASLADIELDIGDLDDQLGRLTDEGLDP